ncbi:hypothetical protein CJI97_005544 [Candidozyma auris]|nr:hypothetical protein CJI97_005544 [[Candida] auris]
MTEDNKRGFIQTRLDSLHEIDNNIVKLLDGIGSIFDTYIEPSKQDVQDLATTKEKFIDGTKRIYSLLGSIAIGLRKEVKIMDENIGVYDKNDENVMILPISIDQKHTSLGRDRLEKEVKNMQEIVKIDNADGQVKVEEKDVSEVRRDGQEEAKDEVSAPLEGEVNDNDMTVD